MDPKICTRFRPLGFTCCIFVVDVYVTNLGSYEAFKSYCDDIGFVRSLSCNTKIFLDIKIKIIAYPDKSLECFNNNEQKISITDLG